MPGTIDICRSCPVTTPRWARTQIEATIIVGGDMGLSSKRACRRRMAVSASHLTDWRNRFFGNPAVSVLRPVALRPDLATGLPLSEPSRVPSGARADTAPSETCVTSDDSQAEYAESSRFSLPGKRREGEAPAEPRVQVLPSRQLIGSAGASPSRRRRTHHPHREGEAPAEPRATC